MNTDQNQEPEEFIGQVLRKAFPPPENPPAFPISYESQNLDGSVSYQRWAGMTLWDYFAAHAPQETMAKFHPDGTVNEEATAELLARRRCLHADAMLAERAKRGIK